MASLVPLAEDGDRALAMFHRSVFVAGGVVQVGQVVLERRLTMAVAAAGAQRQCALGQLECRAERAGVAPAACKQACSSATVRGLRGGTPASFTR